MPASESAGVLKAEYQLPFSRYPVDFRRFPDLKEFHAFTHGVLQKAERLPGVDAAAVSGYHPLDPGFTNSFRIIGREAEAPTQPEISIRRVTAGYFRTMAVPLCAGRRLTDRRHHATRRRQSSSSTKPRRGGSSTDRNRSARRSTSAARRARSSASSATSDSRGWPRRPRSRRMLPLDQAPSVNGAGVLLVRTIGDPKALVATVRGVIREQDPALAVFGLEPFAETTVSRSVAERRFTMLVLGTLASVALILAAIGVHGVLSYTVTERAREIGIRLALGAQPSGVLRLVVTQGMMLALTGTAIGLAAAFVLTRSMGTLLFGVTPTDPGHVRCGSCGAHACGARRELSSGAAARRASIR